MKKGGESLAALIRDINKQKFWKKKQELDEKKYFELILKEDISVKLKKKKLIEELYNIMVHTFAFKPEKRSLKAIKANINISRALVIKLKHINYYLKEINKIKKSSKKAYLTKKDMDKLEFNVKCLLVNFDKKYRKPGKKPKQEKIKDLGLLIEKQSELLRHIESKLPPGRIITGKLLKPDKYNQWVARLLALIAELMSSYKKETRMLKKSNLGKEINIIRLIKENQEILKKKEAQMLAENRIEEFDHDWENTVKELGFCLRL